MKPLSLTIQMKATEQYFPVLLLGMANGLTKNRGLAKFQLSCKRLVVSFFDRSYASRNSEFSAKQFGSKSLDFFRISFLEP